MHVPMSTQKHSKKRLFSSAHPWALLDHNRDTSPEKAAIAHC
jgi:hypothetical protein